MRTLPMTIKAAAYDFEGISSYSNERLMEYLTCIENPFEFCKSLFTAFSSTPSTSSIRVIYHALHIQTNFDLKEEILSYYGLPIFVKLSESRLKHEIETSHDERLKHAVLNISSALSNGNDLRLKIQAGAFQKLVDSLLVANDEQFIKSGLELTILLLLQPSCRRFIKPFLEDILFVSVIKVKFHDMKLIQELENVYYFPIDEQNGVSFGSQEEYVSAHFTIIRSLQFKLLEYHECSHFTQIPSSVFDSREQIYQALISSSQDGLHLILSRMGCAGYSKDLSRDILLNAIIESLVLRNPLKIESIPIFPTELNLVDNLILRPLTTENLSRQDLLERHMKILQTSLFEDLAEHVKYNIEACRPVLNSQMKTEFSSWTRDAMEVVSSAIVKTSSPDVQRQGKHQKIELEVSIPTAPLDQMTLTSWMNLKTSDVVFICRVDALEEDGTYYLKTMRTVSVDSKTISKSSITFKLLVDPVQFDLDSRTEVYSKINFIVKRSSSESNDIRTLVSSSALASQIPPEFIEDAILGFSHPDEVLSPEALLSDLHIDSSLSSDQSLAVETCLNSGLFICEGPFGSGCTTVLRHVVKCLLNHNKNTTIIFRSGQAVDSFYRALVESGIPEHQIVRLGFSSSIGHIQQKYTQLIKSIVDKINQEILFGLDSNIIYTCGEADYIRRSVIEPRWKAFRILLESESIISNIIDFYPFAKCLNIDSHRNGNVIYDFESHFNEICSVFNVAKQLAPLELLQSNVNVLKYALGNLSKVVLMTAKYAAINSKVLADNGHQFESLFVDNCNLIPEIDTLLTLASQSSPSNLIRLGLFGHSTGGRPQCFSDKLREAGASITLMDRFMCSGFSKTIRLSNDHDYQPLWTKLSNSMNLKKSNIFKNSVQFINVPPVLGKGEEMPMRNYIQNLDEAEFAVALFQLLRLNGTQAADIAILTAYKGQVDLINEVLQTRCSWADFYSEPAFIGTIDQSVGLHFKNVIISLVRTKSVGFLSDPSRLELAVSRAGESLLILGLSELFAATKDDFFKKLTINTGDNLVLADGAEFNNVETISKYVYDLSLQTLQ